MRGGRRRRLLLLLLSALAGCLPREAPRGTPLPPEALLGTYDLVSVGGRPLPLREFRAVYHGGELTLHADHRYAAAIDVETCAEENVCTRETATSEGSWRILPDGTLSLEAPGQEAHDPAVEAEAPPPRIEADGREIRYYSVAGEIPVVTYRRR
jgi:hypothetical protein